MDWSEEIAPGHTRIFRVRYKAVKIRIDLKTRLAVLIIHCYLGWRLQ